MRLALKFALAFLLGMCVILAVHAYRLYQRETELFDTDMRHDDRMIGEVVASSLRRVWQALGPAPALELVEQANRSENLVRIRWIWLDAPPGDPHRARVAPEHLAPLAQGQEVVWQDRRSAEPGYLYTYVPVIDERGKVGALEAAESLDLQRHFTRQTLAHVAVAGGTIAVLAAVLALVVGFWFVGRPIHVMIDRARRVATGDFFGALRFPQHDEIGVLAKELNLMCGQLADARTRVAAETAARIEALEQLRHADRLRTVGQLTSGLAHELGTPLNVVWARAKMIAKREMPAAEAAGSARIIAEQSERMIALIRRLLDFARPRIPKKTRVDPCQVVRQTFALLAPIAEKGQVTLNLAEGAAPLPLEVDADQLQQVLSNLILNAIQAMPHGGPVTVNIERQRVRPPADLGGPENDYVCVSVRDAGGGIAPEHLPHVFEPFFTTKDVGEGTGLGLSISLGIIREHGGWIAVASQLGQGACFRVYLPQGPE